MRAYRNAASAIEGLEEDAGLMHRQMACKGLKSIENLGPQIAGVIEAFIQKEL